MKNISQIPALAVSHLTVYYHKMCVLSDCSVIVPQGIMMGIIGPNGAGKTTFIKSLLGFIPVDSGNISIVGFSGKNIYKHVAYVPQRSSVDWDFPLTVFDMVLMGCYGKLGWFRRPSKDDYQKTYDVLAEVGLQDVAHNPIGTLSGGQQQRAFIARALLQDSPIYFLDEPFAGVDTTSEKIIIALFKKLRDAGKTIIVVHHDLLTAPCYFDWALLLNKKVIACGPMEQVFTPEYLNAVYGTNVMCHPWNVVLKKDEQ